MHTDLRGGDHRLFWLPELGVRSRSVPPSPVPLSENEIFKTMLLRKNVCTAMIMLLKVSLTLSPTLFPPPSNVSKWRGLRGLVPLRLKGREVPLYVQPQHLLLRSQDVLRFRFAPSGRVGLRSLHGSRHLEKHGERVYDAIYVE